MAWSLPPTPRPHTKGDTHSNTDLVYSAQSGSGLRPLALDGFGCFGKKTQILVTKLG